jgi:hypothetical protein
MSVIDPDREEMYRLSAVVAAVELDKLKRQKREELSSCEGSAHALFHSGRARDAASAQEPGPRDDRRLHQQRPVGELDS